MTGRLIILVVATIATAFAHAQAKGDGATSSHGGAPVRDVEAAVPPWGVDLDAMDRTVAPGDDFYRYVNGHWLRGVVVPADRFREGTRQTVSDRNREKIRAIIVKAAANEAPAGALEQKIGDLYAAYVDVPRRDALGFGPLESELGRIRGVDDAQALAKQFGRFPFNGGVSPFQGFIEVDFNRPERRIFYLVPGGLGMSGLQNYLDDGAGFEANRAAYRAYASAVLERLGYPDAERLAGDLVALEIRLAGHFPSATRQRDFGNTAHPFTRDTLATDFPGFDWDTFFASAGLSEVEELIVRFPESMGPMVAEIQATPVDTWRAWMSFRLVAANSDFLDSEARARRFELFDGPVWGKTQPSTLEEDAIAYVQSVYSMELGRLFVQHHFSPRGKAMVEEMFEHIRATVREAVETADWMDEPTRDEARRKVDSLKAKIGYPDVWREVPAGVVDRNDLFASVVSARSAAWNVSLGWLRQPPDADEWQMSPQNTGSGFHPALNELTIPAGNLQPPFFDEHADAAVNYGAIGGVIAHEVIHAFDDIGRKFDSTGALRDWWTPSSEQAFRRRAEELVRQYGQYEPIAGHPIDGQLTLGENIADISGLAIAHDAYLRAIDGEPQVRDGFTGSQRVFLGWAQMRRNVDRPEFALQLLTTDNHAPAEYRVNGVVRNIDAWYAAFAVDAGDTLYLAPDARARIW